MLFSSLELSTGARGPYADKVRGACSRVCFSASALRILVEVGLKSALRSLEPISGVSTAQTQSSGSYIEFSLFDCHKYLLPLARAPTFSFSIVGSLAVAVCLREEKRRRPVFLLFVFFHRTCLETPVSLSAR